MRTFGTRQHGRIVAGTAALTLLVTACSGGSGAEERRTRERRLPPVKLARALTPFDSCAALESWVHREAGSRVTAYGLGGPRYGYMEGDATAGIAEDSAKSASPLPTTPAVDYSTTNVQVEGVDEPDIIKTDGRRILAVTADRIVLASAADEKILDTFLVTEVDGGRFAVGPDSQLLMAGDRALVLTASYQTGIMEKGVGAADSFIATPRTVLLELDLSGDRLQLVDRVEIDGRLISARMVDDVARVVLHDDPQERLGFVMPVNGDAASMERAKTTNRDVIEASKATDWLPHWHRTTDADSISDAPLLDCADAQQPATFSGFGVLSVLSIDLAQGLVDGVGAQHATGVMAGGETVYASAAHLYVAAPAYVAPVDVLTDVQQQPEPVDPGTEIHRFDISDPERAIYEMSGHVAGTVLDQYGLDEQGDTLRVATQTWARFGWGDDSESHVVVLQPRAGALAEVGRVDGLGQGEQLHAVRFIGNVAYVVTFEQTDPLFTIDLSDPTNPRVVGELKMLGYSAYLHPIADAYLLGVGQDATEEGRQLGMQVALYDVRDPANPTRIAQQVLTGASSDAEFDPHAFLWWAQTGLAAVPVQQWDDNGNSLAAEVGYRVDAAAGTITEVGRVTHPDAVAGENDYPDSYASTIRRAVVIGPRLWTLSNSGLQASDLTTLAPGPFLPAA